MSDLYLVLRSRLDAVTNWVTISSDVLKEARTARGLSFEAVSRQASCSSKTYERYEKAGRLPEHMVETFADILGLEIERPTRTTTRVTIAEPISSEMVAVVERLDRVADEVEGLRRELREALAKVAI